MADVAADVSVVIRTFDAARWEDLVGAVASVQRQTITPRDVVVVVDHNPALLARARDELTSVTVVANRDARGASGGMNSGAAAAQGEIVAFLDDDASALPDWLEQLVRPYDDPLVAGVGGKIEPAWTQQRPEWFPSEFNWVIGCTFPGGFDAPGKVRSLIGANMSFRRDVLRQMDGFRTDVGAVGASLSKCEDTEFCIRVSQRWPDRILRYEPRAVVRHRVPARRATFDYFRSRCYHEGLAKAGIARLVGSTDALASERRYTTRVLPQGVLRNLWVTGRRREVAGARRAGAIVAGFAFTAAGYALGAARQRLASA